MRGRILDTELVLVYKAARHPDRPKDKGLYKAMKDQWDPWMENEKKEESLSRSIELKNGEFLSHVIRKEVTCKEWEKDWKAGGTERYDIGR